MHASALDPLVRGHTQTERYIKALPSLLTNALKEDELEMFMLEVPHYNTAKLPNPTPETKIDEWWVERACRYSTIWEVVKAVVSCFHGPSVESSFSIMGNIITSQTARISICLHSNCEVHTASLTKIKCASVSPALVNKMKTAYEIICY